MVTAAPDQPKRTRKERAQLSCTFCRHRKLKCDRNQPCQNCVKRSQAATCRYATPQAGRVEKHQGADGSGLQTRIQHLEDLVVSIMSGQSQKSPAQTQFSKPPAAAHAAETPDVKPLLRGSSDGGRSASVPEDETLMALGKMNVVGQESSYVGNEHWAAILDDIAEVKKHIGSEEDSPDSAHDQGAAFVDGPDILLGVSKPLALEEYLEALPPRQEMDRLVSRYLNSPDPFVALLHSQSFQVDYERFCAEPEAAPLSWLGLIFGIMSQASFFVLLGCEANSEQAAMVMEDCSTYRRLAAQCLIASDYTKPVRWTLEGLMLYLGNEFIRSTESQMGLWVVLGIVIRLAMRMGYHRDSRHFSQIAAFQGEMRRRMWAVLIQLDLLSSVQLGMPRMIRPDQTDTRFPGNYLDADLSEDMAALPPARPDAEYTHMSYHIFKGRLTKIVGSISDEATATAEMPYERALQLDAELTAEFDAMPDQLQARTLVASVADGTAIILKRINLALLYHKGVCILHRRFITLAKDNERFARSRARSMESAKAVLRHQITMFEETQPGGRVHGERWMISGLATEDFTLAAMVVCLNLDMFWDQEAPTLPHPRGSGDKAELLYLIERSYAIWNVWKTQPGLATSKANKACQVLGVMLRKIQSVVAPAEPGWPLPDAGAAAAGSPGLSSATYTDPSPMDTSATTASGDTGLLTPHDLMADPYSMPDLPPIPQWIDAPQDINWQEWDDIFQPDGAIGLPEDVWAFAPDPRGSHAGYGVGDA